MWTSLEIIKMASWQQQSSSESQMSSSPSNSAYSTNHPLTTLQHQVTLGPKRRSMSSSSFLWTPRWGDHETSCGHLIHLVRTQEDAMQPSCIHSNRPVKIQRNSRSYQPSHTNPYQLQHLPNPSFNIKSGWCRLPNKEMIRVKSLGSRSKPSNSSGGKGDGWYGGWSLSKKQG